jgi:hypothetical protein
MKITATCIDRSNWCGEWQDTACTAGTGAVKGSRVSLGSNGPGLQSYSDSTLAFENLNGGCVGIDATVPTSAQLTQKGHVAFSTTARIYKDSSGKLWLQAATLLNSAGANILPPTPSPTPYPTKAAPSETEATAQTSNCSSSFTLEDITEEQFTPAVQSSVESAVAAEYDVHDSQVDVEIDQTGGRRLDGLGGLSAADPKPELKLTAVIHVPLDEVEKVQGEMAEMANSTALQGGLTEKINQFIVEDNKAAVAAAAAATKTAAAEAAADALASQAAADEAAKAKAAADEAAAAAAANLNDAALQATAKAAADEAATAAAGAAAAATVAANAAAAKAAAEEAAAAIPEPPVCKVAEIAPPVVVVVTEAPTAYPTAVPTTAPTPHHDQPFAVTIAGGNWETCGNWANEANNYNFCPLPCAVVTVTTATATLDTAAEIKHLEIEESGSMVIDASGSIAIDSEVTDCCAGLVGNYDETTHMCWKSRSNIDDWKCPNLHPYAYSGGVNCCSHYVNIEDESCPGTTVTCPSGQSRNANDMCSTADA